MRTGTGVFVGVGVLVGVLVEIGVGVGVAFVRKVLSSTAKPSSAPDALKSSQRIKNVAPLGILNPVIVALIAVRFAAALPSSAPTVPVVTGLEKSSASTSVHVPVVRVVALVLYWKSSRSGPRPEVPKRHCSPVYEIERDVIATPELLTKQAPIVGIKLPL